MTIDEAREAVLAKWPDARCICVGWEDGLPIRYDLVTDDSERHFLVADVFTRDDAWLLAAARL